jgi:hypothetical protein
MKTKTYISQAARDAESGKYGDATYWQYLDESAQRASEYYRKKGDMEQAERMLTRTLSEALQGNDGN